MKDTAMKLALAGVLLLAFAAPSVAQEPACHTMDQMVKDLEAAGAKVAGVANYNGTQTDELIIVQTPDMIMLVGFKDGCFVGYQAIEPAVPQKDA
jgi:hypothetical protein